MINNEIENVEVEYDIYCPRCKHVTMGDEIDPCDDCLAHPFNTNSAKPVNFEEK